VYSIECCEGFLRDLKAWKKSIDIVVMYAFTRAFPKDEQYGLTAWLRTTAVFEANYMLNGLINALNRAIAA
jgi:hypothetical protein